MTMRNTEEIYELQLFDLRRNRRPAQKKHKVKPLYVVAGAVIVIYLVGAAFFSSHFYQRGTVFGVNMFGQTTKSLQKKIEKKIAGYKLDIETRNGEEILTGEEIGMQYVDNGMLERLMDEQSPFLWPSLFFSAGKGTEQKIEISYNEGLLQENLAQRTFFDESYSFKPENAYIRYGNGQFEIVPEEDGTQIREDKTLKTVEKALKSGADTVNLEDNDCYVTPDITKEDASLLEECEELNAFLGAELTFDFGDRTEVVDADVIQSWILENEDGEYSLSKESVWNYVAKLADKYDTRGKERIFRTHSGEEVTLDQGDYGWEMNQEETAQRLYDAIGAGETGELEVDYIHTAKSRNENDLGDIYVEVSIEDQEMWLYVDGECVVDTPVVTGNPNNGDGTPAGGVWDIDYKQSPAVLGTIEKNGYSTPVTYWLPFNGNVGIHDADGWRSSYGGNIYEYGGSHGCVNTPTENAKIIYETVEEGTAVVVY